MSEITPLMLGTGISSSKEYNAAYQVVLAGLSGGIRGFDTAPSYGTEKMLGNILQDCCKKCNINREELHIQTKIDAWQMQEGNIASFVNESLDKMNLSYFDALLIHWPVPDYLEKTWEAMIELYQLGKVKQLGICNVRMRQLKKIVDWEFIPHIIQIERNPLRTCIREVEFCHKYGLKIQAYSPLCKMDARIRDNANIQEIAKKYNKSVGQIVLRWHVDTGVMPIFTSSKPYRIQEYVDIMDFILDSDDISAINQINEDYKIYLEACACPGF